MRLSLIALIFAIAPSLMAAEPATSLLADFKLVFEETFSDEASVGKLQFSDPQAWRWSKEGKEGGALELYKQSKYETKYRSPFNIGLVSQLQVSDFVLEVDVLQTGKEYGHRDMCLFFGFVSPTEYYYSHLATKPDANAHNVFLVNNAARQSFLKVPKQGIDWGSDWKHLRLERSGRAIRVFFENMEEPILAGENDQFLTGGVGLGSFDDTGKIDNLRVWAKSAERYPAPWFAASQPSK